jgi:hypothetical protein
MLKKIPPGVIMSPPLQEKKISAVYIADHVLDQNFTACDGFFLIRL